MITEERPRQLHHERRHQTQANSRARGRDEKLIESQTLSGPVGLSFLYTKRAKCSVFRGRVGRGHNRTNHMESPPMALKTPRAAQCVLVNAGRTAWQLPKEQTCRLSAAVLRIVIFKYSHI